MEYDTLIAVTSWEDRFKMGINHFLEKNSVKCVILLNFIEYKDYTKNNISTVGYSAKSQLAV